MESLEEIQERHRHEWIVWDYEHTLAMLESERLKTKDSANWIFDSHKLARIASCEPYGLFAEALVDGKTFEYYDGECHVVRENEDIIGTISKGVHEYNKETWRLEFPDFY
tara:strand:- start:281 stop:610 length:330 start_codon:yes stop_codon:yes gene_type:complete